jgi:AraC-like DNA-binding protein
MDDFWRSRAGVPRSRGVLAARPGDPQPGDPRPGDPRPGGAPLTLVRLPPTAELADLVRHYWIPRWSLPDGRSVTQRVLEYPSANLVVEGDEVAVHGPSIGLGTRTLTGEGAAFGVLLQPGVAAVLLDIPARSLVARTVPLETVSLETVPLETGRPQTSEDSPRLSLGHEASARPSLGRAVRRPLDGGDDQAAVTAFETWLRGLALDLPADAHLVRAIVERAEEDRSIVRVEQLATVAGLGVRRLERIIREQLGLTPKWLIRRYRLQEAAERLAAVDRPALAELAADLGYADQAHFTREFSAVVGVPPGRYIREAGA